MAVEVEGDNITACVDDNLFDPSFTKKEAPQVLLPQLNVPHMEDPALILPSWDSIVACPDPYCGFFFERWDDGSPSPSSVDEYFNEYRFRCRKCDKDFCSHCKQAPYHKGYTCEGFKTREESILCRFCEAPLDPSASKTGDQDCIDNYHCSSCVNAASSCHSELFPCGHASHFHSSFASEESAVCLHSACVSGDEPTLDDFCAICGYEPLRLYPLVRLDGCHHVFHQVCLDQRFSETTNPISLNPYGCPLCNTPIENGLNGLALQEVTHLRKDLKNRIPAQLIESKIDIPYGPEDTEYLSEALRKLNYYRCFKCHSVYFGGLRECGEQVNLPSSEYVCAGCRSCSVHGADQMIFKCRFCCSVADFFCFGHTHFCTPCHDRAWELVAGGNNAYLNQAVQPCPGGEACPLQVPHAPNGEEFVLGCGACRDQEISGVEFQPEPELERAVYQPNRNARNPVIDNPNPANDFAARRNVVVRELEPNKFLPPDNEGGFGVGRQVGGRIGELLQRLRRG